MPPSDRPYRVALIWRGDADARRLKLSETRLARIAGALEAVGIAVEPAPYSEAFADEVRTQLLRLDGVLVWVNPVDAGRNRADLDALLRGVARAGVFVSAHPDTIDTMGTKDVLYRTRALGWGCDTRRHASVEALRDELGRLLAAGEARVLKHVRGNGGEAVWKVESVAGQAAGPLGARRVRVRPAQRGSREVETTFDELVQSYEGYLAAGGVLVDQPYQARLADGMIRCYLVRDRVAGFGEQLVNALHPPPPGADPDAAPQPGPRLYYPSTRPDFQRLKHLLEAEWLPAMQRTLGIDADALPVIWDADFLYGPKDAAGADSYVLCEINVSAVFPFPDEALEPLARDVHERLSRRARAALDVG